MAEGKGVEAVERALRVLDCFDGDGGALSLAELARRTGFYKSTILRLAASLERFDYLARREDGRFRLGPSGARLGAAYRRSFDLAEAVEPELAALATRTGETASFFVRDGESRVCLRRCEPARAIRHALSEGARTPLTLGASAVVLRAFAGAEDEESAAARRAGFAVSLGARDPEVGAAAVPVRDLGGALRGALAVSGPIGRFAPPAQPALVAALQASRARLEAQIAA